jgi:hypothetical protein
MQTYRLTVDADGIVRVPNVQPGQTVTVQVDDQPAANNLTLATAKTPQERAAVISRLQRIAHELHQELRSMEARPESELFGEDGLPV